MVIGHVATESPGSGVTTHLFYVSIYLNISCLFAVLCCAVLCCILHPLQIFSKDLSEVKYSLIADTATG